MKADKYDVLVIGGGGAGLRAAIEAASAGASVALVNKGRTLRSGATVMADSDLTLDGRGLRELGFFGEPRDSKDKFFNDILSQGFFLNDQPLLEIYVNDAPKRVGELIEWGLPVIYTEERAIETPGYEIVGVLRRVAREKGVNIMDDVYITDLLTSSGTVAGAYGIDLISGTGMAFAAKSVVLATGGWQKAYMPNAASRDLAGDGQAMALRAGASLRGAEFIGFIPTSLLWPKRYAGSLFTYILHMIVGGPLYNSKGQNILELYDQQVISRAVTSEWNKSVLSHIIFKEYLEGRAGPHGGVFFAPSERAIKENQEAFDLFFKGWNYRGGDLSEVRDMILRGEPLEVGPAAEYMIGGIDADERYYTGVPGLFVAGECAISPFGANRVVAATTEMLVSGAIAGRTAAEHAGASSGEALPEDKIRKAEEMAFGALRAEGQAAPRAVIEELGGMTWRHLGPIRDAHGISELLNYVRRIRRDLMKLIGVYDGRSYYNLDLIEAIELQNMLDVVEASATSALAREESRGAHYRADFPMMDNNSWLKETLVRSSPGGLSLSFRRVRASRIQPPAGVYDYMDAVKLMMSMRSDITGGH